MITEEYLAIYNGFYRNTAARLECSLDANGRINILPKHFIDKYGVNEMNYGIIYKITNLVNNKTYIGKTTGTFNKRYPGSKWWKYSSNKRLKEDFLICGKESFSVEILEKNLSDKNQSDMEEIYIKMYNSLSPNGYNLIADTRHKILSQETRDKLSKNVSRGKLGKKLSEEHRRNISKGNTGKTASVETRKKLSLANTGKHPSEEAREKMRNKKGCKPILQIDLITNEIIKEFKSLGAACREHNLFKPNVSQVCKGKTKQAGGFGWKYK